MVAVFEHGDNQPVLFGQRPTFTAHCNGKPCSLARVNGRLATTWQNGQRNISLVGARDLDEVSEFVAWLGRPG